MADTDNNIYANANTETDNFPSLIMVLFFTDTDTNILANNDIDIYANAETETNNSLTLITVLHWYR